MAHYAKVKDGIVTQVIVAEPEFFDTFVDDDAGRWVETSFNMKGGVYIDPTTQEPADDQSIVDGDPARERKNFAGVGYIYDTEKDLFYSPQSFDSWTLDETTATWEAPVAYPTDGSFYTWDEDAYNADTSDPKTAGWVLFSNAT